MEESFGHYPELETDEFEKNENDMNKMDKFGWFYKRNGTSWADGTLTMLTGEDDIANLGKIHLWDGEKETPAFQGECSKIKGSADGLFPPGLNEEILLFSTDLCRPLNF